VSAVDSSTGAPVPRGHHGAARARRLGPIAASGAAASTASAAVASGSAMMSAAMSAGTSPLVSTAVPRSADRFSAIQCASRAPSHGRRETSSQAKAPARTDRRYILTAVRSGDVAPGFITDDQDSGAKWQFRLTA
jgi:hypothetical protein